MQQEDMCHHKPLLNTNQNLALTKVCANSKLIEHIVEFESCQSSLPLPLMDGFWALFTHEIVLKIFLNLFSIWL